jgi:drug/metabolite transporter (DMT)-like permease
MSAPQWLALLAAVLFGLAHTLSRFGLRYVPPRVGASISVPATAILFWLAAPFLLNLTGLSWRAIAWFATIGLFFPAAVTILNFESTQRMGPTISSSIGATSATFALLTALLFLGEPLTWLIAFGTATIVVGVALLSWRRDGATRHWASWMLLIPLAAAAIRGNAQTLSKYALTLWSNPFAASLVGYTVSAVILTIIGRSRFAGRNAGNGVTGALDRRAIPWFVALGFCNGLGLYLTYIALQTGAVGVVAPIVTTAPLFTLLANKLLLHDEPMDAPVVSGVMITVVGVIMILIH